MPRAIHKTQTQMHAKFMKKKSWLFLQRKKYTTFMKRLSHTTENNMEA
jgi:hypothetical protein